MSQKYVKGVKRNQIIQRWLQGVDDPDYEVFPTKKEGKYIVKLRETPLTDKHEVESLVDESNEVPVDEVPVDVTPPNETVKRAPTRKQPTTTNGINLEILEQLRNLGEELRNDRFKKEQKQYIKHVVNKELNKSRIRLQSNSFDEIKRSKYVPDVFACKASPLTKSNVNSQPTNDSTTNEQPTNEITTNEQPIFRSRIRR
ncbi:hypothetical protein M9Y10_045021 [Tritrichomonas musculus]|uniref:Uncharacterized protein n=1 Tax=Tritrichomonas musculus TaxID=1915356 RepID=A0ABR2JU27_9EUKA